MKEVKRCARCATVKPRLAFNRHARRADGLQVYCRACSADLSHARYEMKAGRTIPRRLRKVYVSARGAWLRSLKAGRPCTDCERTFSPQVMQWDHLPQFEKIGDISAGFWGRTEAEILRELTKCELVCVNCHTIRTFRRNGWGTWSLHETEAAHGETWTQAGS